MIYAWGKPHFYVSAKWPARREDPTSIAQRLKRYLDDLGAIDESLRRWSVGLRDKIDYPASLADLAARVRGDVVHDQDGSDDVDWGYKTYCRSLMSEQIFSIRGSAGGVYGPTFLNEFMFETNSMTETNFSIVTYRLMKAAMLATIACWEPAYCITRSNQITPDYKNEGHYTKAWMTYVPPAYANTVDLVGIPFSERIADGGLLLSATEETFRPEHPVHLDGATRISQALQPLNATLPQRKRPPAIGSKKSAP